MNADPFDGNMMRHGTQRGLRQKRCPPNGRVAQGNLRASRINSAGPRGLFFRSMATRGRDRLETAGIGQGESAVVGICDVSLYVMSPDFGSAGQLEKIDMLDRADLVALRPQVPLPDRGPVLPVTVHGLRPCDALWRGPRAGV